MNYVDGFVAAVPLANRQAFIDHAAFFADIFRDLGALEVVDCWGDAVPEGKVTSFPMAVRREGDEVVVFSWVRWPSKATRDAAWDALTNDPRMEDNPMPFDGRRMIYGGFEAVIERRGETTPAKA